ncbi:hypothetical protein YYG_04987 [Plasmodium vinckei petteri]|uniref:Uncharacterized protein n=1 Tax=Plasmodium vinckei petteri TaxID=138298 RepID=W7AWI9_PLAVN|nr:hypothetical protein YYG_04987 [Plasmodium vinckei petteri]
MLLLYLVFVVIPFIAFSYYIYKSVLALIHEKQKKNEFFSCLKSENKQHAAFENFANKYEVEKYALYLKAIRNIKVDYKTNILDDINKETNEDDKENDQKIDSILEDIYNDNQYAEHNVIGNPQASWMRKLPNADIIKLKVMLLKKTILFLPICNKIFHDKNKKSKLYNNYYIDDNMSRDLDIQCDQFLEEFNFIIYEANCIADKWGETIISDAYRIFHHNKIKISEEKKKKEEQQALLKKQKQKEKKLKEETEKANLLADQIIDVSYKNLININGSVFIYKYPYEENAKKKKKKSK